jgi:hypothetical protein
MFARYHGPVDANQVTWRGPPYVRFERVGRQGFCLAV